VRAIGIAALLVLGCRQPSASPAADSGVRPVIAPSPASSGEAADTDEARAFRAELVREVSDDVKDPRVLDAMRLVPRHFFVPGASLVRAYGDHPVPIGYGQTISQPAVVGVMSQALELKGGERVLEIGTGSGYQAAILSVLAREVYTIEIVRELAEEASARLARLGYANVHVRAGDGYKGWPELAPFDRIMVTAAPDEVPRVLFDQLADGGILVAPVGPTSTTQRLLRFRKSRGQLAREDLGAVRFVPMVPGK
jgi:protein-L-isoaspartate(D-aspartate) O-methyltransferase